MQRMLPFAHSETAGIASLHPSTTRAAPEAIESEETTAESSDILTMPSCISRDDTETPSSASVPSPSFLTTTEESTLPENDTSSSESGLNASTPPLTELLTTPEATLMVRLVRTFPLRSRYPSPTPPNSIDEMPSPKNTGPVIFTPMLVTSTLPSFMNFTLES